MSESSKSLQDRRQRVIDLLCDGFSRDALEVDEFEDRIDQAHRATSQKELDALLEGMRPPTADDLALVPRAEVALSTDANHPTTGTALAILGGTERKGEWRVPKKLRSVSLMGGSLLDFREATFAPGCTELTVVSIMGGCDILVPPGLAVECNGAAVMGAFESLERSAGSSSEDRPLLRITGFALMGAVEVETRLPGESRREAKRRRKKERKLAAEERKQLSS